MLSLSPNARLRFAAALVAAAAAIPFVTRLTGPALAQEAAEPVWSQFQAGPGHPGSIDDGPEPPFRERWRFPAPEGVSLSGAVILGDLAMTVGQRAVYGVDLADGTMVWEVPRAAGPPSVPALAAGEGGAPDTLLYLDGPVPVEAAPSPTASGSRTATASPSATPSPTPSPGDDAGTGSVLVALDLTEGTPTERWRVPLEDGSTTGVTVDDDVAYVGDDGGAVTAVSVADGEIRWSAGLGADGPCSASPGEIDTSVAVSEGLVVSVARNLEDGSVVVSGYEEADGACRWRVGSRLGSTAVSAPAALDGRPVVGLADRSVRALAGSDGAEVWSELVVSIFLPVSAPALDADHLVVADVGGGVYRLDPDTGERLWSQQLNERVLRSSPVVSGDAVLIGLADGRLVALDGDTGHLVWQSEPTPGLVGTIALAPDLVVAVKGGRDAGLIAFEHDPEGTLVDVPSPAELDPAVTLVRLGIASVITLVITLVPGMLARRRFGDAFAEHDEDGEIAPVGDDA